MIAGSYAQDYTAQDGVVIKHVMSIASPWRGVPVVDRFIAGKGAPKRFNQMGSENEFRQQLVASVLDSERKGERKYYSIGSEVDLLVPGVASMMTEDPRRQRMFSYMGHCGIIASRHTWVELCSWLDGIYDKQAKTANLNPGELLASL